MCAGKARKISHDCIQSACNGVTADAHAVHVASSTPVEQSATDVSQSETRSIEPVKSIPKPTDTSSGNDDVAGFQNSYKDQTVTPDDTLNCDCLKKAPHKIRQLQREDVNLLPYFQYLEERKVPTGERF